jgi:hypothetical protein
MPTSALADATEGIAGAAEDSGKVVNDFQYATFDAADGSWLRRGGENRYDTMEQVVQTTFERSNYAILATGDAFADALLANGLAGTIKCPVLLTARNTLSNQAKTELERLLTNLTRQNAPRQQLERVKHTIKVICSVLNRETGAIKQRKTNRKNLGFENQFQKAGGTKNSGNGKAHSKKVKDPNVGTGFITYA